MRNTGSNNGASRRGGRDARGSFTDGYNGRNRQSSFSGSDDKNYRHRHSAEEHDHKRRGRYNDNYEENYIRHRDDDDFEDRDINREHGRSYDETVREDYYRPARIGGRFSHGHRDEEYNRSGSNENEHYGNNDIHGERNFESRDLEEYRRGSKRSGRSSNNNQEEDEGYRYLVAPQILYNYFYNYIC